MYLDKVASAIPRSCPKWWNEIRLTLRQPLICRRRDNVTRWNIAQIRGTGFCKLLTISFIVVDPVSDGQPTWEQIFRCIIWDPFIRGDEENVLGSSEMLLLL
jgi:hypothetical protein